MKAIKQLAKNKSGNVIILILAVIMCVFFPVMAVLYDLGQVRMYQQDVKNAQEIAGLACVGVSRGSFGSSSGGAFGGFNQSTCQPVATVAAWGNLGVEANIARTISQNGNMDTSRFEIVKKYRKDSRLVACKGETPRVATPPTPDGGHFSVHITGLCYKPMFIKPSLLNFQVLNHSAYDISPKFRDEIPVQVRPSWFSAVYDARD